MSGWCEGSMRDAGHHTGQRPKARKIRCPVCNRRLTQKITTCGDHGCWHIHVPRHKEKA